MNQLNTHEELLHRVYLHENEMESFSRFHGGTLSIIISDVLTSLYSEVSNTLKDYRRSLKWGTKVTRLCVMQHEPETIENLFFRCQFDSIIWY